MIPIEIINRLGLIKTDHATGESFINNETIYKLPDFIEEWETFVMGCDERGKPLTDDKVLIFCRSNGYFLRQVWTKEALLNIDLTLIKNIFQKEIKRITK